MRLSRVIAAEPAPGLRALAICSVWAAAVVALRALHGGAVDALILGGMAMSVTAVLAGIETHAVLRSFGRRRRSDRARDEASELAASETADHFVAMEYAAGQRGRPVTLVMFGFDRFDEFTSTYGNAAADAAVRTFGRVLNRLTRKMNLSARYGWRADAFLSVLSESDAAGAQIFVRRVVEALAESGAGPLPAVRAGIAEFDSSIGSPQEFVERAEVALETARAEHATLHVLYRSTAPARRAG